MARPRTRSAPGAHLGALLALFLVACGGGPDAGPSVHRALVLEPADPELPAPQHVLAAHLVPPPQLEPWGVTGTRAELDPQDGGTVLVLADGKEQRITIPVPEGTVFNRAVLSASFEGTPPYVLLRLHGEGDDVYEQGVVVPSGRSGVQQLLFSLEGLRRGFVAQRAQLVLVGMQQRSRLVALDLVHEPLALTLPMPGQAPRPVSVLQEARVGWGLSAGRPAALRFRVEHPGTVLALAVAQPEHARSLGRGPRVRLTLVDEDRETYTRTLVLEDLAREGLRWHELSVPLDRFLGNAVEGRLHYEVDDEEPALVAVGDVRLQRGGSDARTVLLVTSDTHRGDHVGCLHRVDVDTPVVDALAARGVRFDGAWASTCITSPSHAAILTGVHPRDSRLITNNAHLVQEAVTLAERYRDAGFRTLAAVSVRHLGPRGTDATQGFDRVLAPTGEPWPAEEPVARLREWVAEADGVPLFLWLHVFDAHVPHAAPEAFQRRYWPADRDPRDPALPEIGWREGTYPKVLEGLRDLDWARAQYKAEVSHVDAALGDLLAVPRVGSGWIAFTADHGEVLEKDGSYFNHNTLFPDTLHVPLVLGGPGIPEGVVVGGRVDQLDLGRTLLDLSGLAGAPFPGQNLLRTLDDPRPTREPRYALASFGHSASVTQGRWHLVLSLRPHGKPLARDRAELELELYDLEADPECLHECWRAHRTDTRELLAGLLAWLRDADPTALASTGQASQRELEDLLALGYSGSLEDTEARTWIPEHLTVEQVLELQDDDR